MNGFGRKFPSLSPPPTPSAHCDWQRWHAAPKIRPSCASESVPGKLLSYASVMVCSPEYLLISLRLWPAFFTEQVSQTRSRASDLDSSFSAQASTRVAVVTCCCLNFCDAAAQQLPDGLSCSVEMINGEKTNQQRDGDQWTGFAALHWFKLEVADMSFFHGWYRK